jgi:hypothetical protein
MNSIVQNWHYLFAHPISLLHYDIQASIDFSTVVPAVLSTSTLVFQLSALGLQPRGRWLQLPFSFFVVQASRPHRF